MQDVFQTTHALLEQAVLESEDNHCTKSSGHSIHQTAPVETDPESIISNYTAAQTTKLKQHVHLTICVSHVH